MADEKLLEEGGELRIFPCASDPVLWCGEFAKYFRKIGYVVNESDIESFLYVVGEMGISKLSEDLDMAYILKTLIAKDSQQESSFFFVFDDFVHMRERPAAAGNTRQAMYQMQKLGENDSNIKEIEKQIRQLEEVLNKDREFGITDAQWNQLLKLRGRISEDSYLKLMDSGEEVRKFSDRQALEQAAKEELQQAAGEISAMLIQSVMMPDYKNCMNYLAKLGDAVSKLLKVLEKEEERAGKVNVLEKMRAQKNKLEKRRDKLRRQSDSRSEIEMRLIKKLEAIRHRNEFEEGRSAVQVSPIAVSAVMEKDFRWLSKADRDEIKNYIWENTHMFKTALSRKIKSGEKITLNIAETCKLACGTGGIPIRLAFTKPKKSKVKAILFLDISGSCCNASELMLYFMYCMQEAFPGGCRSYVFVNSLYDVSTMFDVPDPNEAVETVMRTIPTRGVYSDYNRPLETFFMEHMHEVTNETILFFIGDARNNWKPSGVPYLKAMCQKAKKAFWLNTEEQWQWNRGDSIMEKYRPYMNAVAEATTPAMLVSALNAFVG